MGGRSSPVSGKTADGAPTEEALASEVGGVVVILGSGSAFVGAFSISREAVTNVTFPLFSLRSLFSLRFAFWRSRHSA